MKEIQNVVQKLSREQKSASDQQFYCFQGAVCILGNFFNKVQAMDKRLCFIIEKLLSDKVLLTEKNLQKSCRAQMHVFLDICDEHDANA